MPGAPLSQRSICLVQVYVGIIIVIIVIVTATCSSHEEYLKSSSAGMSRLSLYSLGAVKFRGTNTVLHSDTIARGCVFMYVCSRAVYVHGIVGNASGMGTGFTAFSHRFCPDRLRQLTTSD